MQTVGRIQISKILSIVIVGHKCISSIVIDGHKRISCSFRYLLHLCLTIIEERDHHPFVKLDLFKSEDNEKLRVRDIDDTVEKAKTRKIS